MAKKRQARSDSFTPTIPAWLKQKVRDEYALIQSHPRERSVTVGVGLISLMMFFAIPQNERVRFARRWKGEKPPSEEVVHDGLLAIWPYKAMTILASMPATERDFFVDVLMATPEVRELAIEEARDFLRQRDEVVKQLRASAARPAKKVRGK